MTDRKPSRWQRWSPPTGPVAVGLTLVMAHVAAEVAEQRIAAAVGAGGTIVDDGTAPSLTVIADQDGNTGVVCVAESPTTKD